MEIVNLTGVEVFKTNVSNGRQATAIVNLLKKHFPGCRINFDLMDCDKILRVEGKIFSPDKIIELVKGKGFECEILE
jgi:hypothetical protein